MTRLLRAEACQTKDMEAGRLLSFPVPLPDETYFSLLSRYHYFYGAGAAADTLLALTGHRGAIPTNGLPSGLRYLATRLPPGHPLTAEEILERNTLWPYFRPFLDLRVAERVERGMIEDRASHANAQAGMLASRVGCGSVPKFCMTCAAEDEVFYGVPYWHRAHQPSGVLACHRHGLVLRTVLYDPAHPHRHSLYLPPLVPAQSVPLVPGPRQFVRAQPLLTLIGRLGEELIERSLRPLDLAAVQGAYRKGLAERGLITAGGHIRSAELRVQFDQVRRLLYPLADYRFLDHQDSYDWLVRLIHNRSSLGHPLKHLVFTAWLYGSLDRFLDVMDEPEACEESRTHEIAQPPIEWATMLPDLLERKRLSLRKAAAVMGSSVDTVRIHAEQLGISIHRRPKRITREVEENIARALANRLSIQDIASRLEVSVVSVYRYGRAHPDLRKKRKDESVRRCLVAYGSRIRCAIDNNPGLSRGEIRRLLPKEYAWLYRHDRPFLMTQMSRLCRAVPLLKQRDALWEERDRLAYHRISRAAQILRHYPGKPIRLTVSALSRFAGIEKIIDKHLPKLPKTAALLRASCETSIQFRKRRIVWAIEESISRGKSLSPSQVLRLADISVSRSASLQSYIRNQLARAVGHARLSASGVGKPVDQKRVNVRGEC